jgi:uncharacterized membrane protein YiaA
MDIITLLNDPVYSTYLLLALALWELPWKGVALWKAAHRNQKGWFIALLVFNTIGVLPIIYIFLIAPRYAEIGEEEIDMSPDSNDTA